MKNITIVGNNVAAMMTAISSAKKGYKVTLINPSKRFGGHFRGVDALGCNFDAGMTFLEFDSFSAQSTDISSYDPTQKNDNGRFVRLIKDALEEYGQYHEVETPKMLFDGKMVPDLYISNKLDVLSGLDKNIKSNMTAEITPNLISGAPIIAHAKNKKHPLFAGLSLTEASVNNHGKTFHNLFIEPFCRNLTSYPTEEFSGLFHRILWLPLFYPETLIESLYNNYTLKENRFHYTYNNSLSSVISKMETDLSSFANITIINKKIDSLAELKLDKLIWADNMDSLLSLCNLPVINTMKSSVAIAFVLVNKQHLKSHFSTLFINEKNLPFRVTNQSLCAQEDKQTVRLCVEWNANDCKNPDYFTKATKDVLQSLNIADDIKDIKVMIFDAFAMPTNRNIIIHNNNRNIIKEALPDISLIGAAAPFGATSFNDQIIQGLQSGL